VTGTRAAADVGWCSVDEVALVQDFIETHWRAGHRLARDGELLRWLYRHPDDDRLLSVLACRDGGRLVGMLGLVQRPFCWLGRALPASWIALWLAAPEARERQAGLALLEDALSRFDVLACLGLNDDAERIYRALRFHVVRPLPRLVRAVDPRAFARLASEADAVLAATARPVPPSTEVVSWEAGAAALWQRTWECQIAPRFVGTARDAAFLRWRYVEHPSYRYVVRFAAGAAALVVHRVEDVAGDRGRVVRFLEALGDPTAVAALVELALAEAPDAALADFTCSSREAAEPFLRAGFVPEDRVRRPPPDRFQPLGRSAHGLAGAFRRRDTAAFAGVPLYVTRGDGDQDRPS
jgi:hypothetical protein